MPRRVDLKNADSPALPAPAPSGAGHTGMPSPTPPTFRDDLEQATAPLRRAIETMLIMSAGTGDTATDLARTLGIETTLAWRVWRLVRARSAEEAAGFIVGATALEKLLSACTSAGADEAVTAAVRDAHREYRAFVQRCAGDESTLRSMLTSSGEDAAAADNANRLMFSASCLRVGVQAASQLRCCVMYPGSLDGIGSAAVIDMYSNLWWLRAAGQAVFRVVRLFHTHAPEDPGAPVLHLATPLDPLTASQPATTPPALPLVSAFCAGNSSVVDRDPIGGSMVYTIKPAAVGRDRASTLCFGEIQHDCVLPLHEDPQMIFSTASMVPSEMLVLEVYVHEAMVREGFVFRPLITDFLFRSLETGLWAPRLEPAAIGGTFSVIEPTAMVDSPIKSPRYRDLVKYVFERIRMDRGNFYCYRLRLPMPQLGLMVSLIAGSDVERPQSA